MTRRSRSLSARIHTAALTPLGRPWGRALGEEEQEGGAALGNSRQLSATLGYSRQLSAALGNSRQLSATLG
eukprot:CAMPEP_0185293980 /NCGR_PEP_ID=MMETSP1363-20130426/7271_1 /TAXON_ID=38817 /ORGANISM="Gephyrocapsa oceanica, Strain RCC1303" /LENGTH=70 /DNA_ID=CAMNT_0027890395 /DNA_START=118 /DNA_END=327 /DNA_ORIENTATION=+